MATAQLEDLVRQSRFIFKGTVEKLGAATMSAAQANDRTAVVKVNEIIHAPRILGDLTGKEITVQLAEPGTVKERQQAVFFTNPWLYGESVAVQEVGRQEISGRASAAASDRLRRRVSGFIERQPDEGLQQHLAEVDAVVVGTVYNNKPLARPGSLSVSEHDPEWWEATISVESMEKGKISGTSVTVLFANSMDVAWFQAPKLRLGQEGIWLLHLRQASTSDIEAPDLPVPSAYLVIHPLDAHGKGEAERVRKLLRRA
jgi:hypothetical protein